MLYKRDEVDAIRKAAVLLWEKGLLANSLDSLLRTLDAYTVDLDWKEEWAFNEHHYTVEYDEYVLFINGLPGSFRWEVWSEEKNKAILGGYCKSVADGENIMLRSIEYYENSLANK